jgi:hypothetical protein
LQKQIERSFCFFWLLAIGYRQKWKAESIEQCAISQKPKEKPKICGKISKKYFLILAKWIFVSFL